MKNETMLGVEISSRTVVVLAPCGGWRVDEQSPVCWACQGGRRGEGGGVRRRGRGPWARRRRRGTPGSKLVLMYTTERWDDRGMHSWCNGVQQFELWQYPMASEGFALKRGETLLKIGGTGDAAAVVGKQQSQSSMGGPGTRWNCVTE